MPAGCWLCTSVSGYWSSASASGGGGGAAAAALVAAVGGWGDDQCTGLPPPPMHDHHELVSTDTHAASISRFFCPSGPGHVWACNLMDDMQNVWSAASKVHRWGRCMFVNCWLCFYFSQVHGQAHDLWVFLQLLWICCALYYCCAKMSLLLVWSVYVEKTNILHIFQGWQYFEISHNI